MFMFYIVNPKKKSSQDKNKNLTSKKCRRW